MPANKVFHSFHSLSSSESYLLPNTFFPQRYEWEIFIFSPSIDDPWLSYPGQILWISLIETINVYSEHFHNFNGDWRARVKYYFAWNIEKNQRIARDQTKSEQAAENKIPDWSFFFRRKQSVFNYSSQLVSIGCVKSYTRSCQHIRSDPISQYNNNNNSHDEKHNEFNG